MDYNVSFVRYRCSEADENYPDLKAGDSYWSWKIKAPEQDTVFGANRLATLEDSLSDYFAYDGHPNVTIALGVSFPGNHGPLVAISDDLYQITKHVEA